MTTVAELSNDELIAELARRLAIACTACEAEAAHNAAPVPIPVCTCVWDRKLFEREPTLLPGLTPCPHHATAQPEATP